MSIPQIIKKPNEEYPIGLIYETPDVETSETCQVCIVSIDLSETDGLKVDGDPVVQSDRVSQVIKGGVDGHDYWVTFKTTTSVGNIYEDKIFVMVRST